MFVSARKTIGSLQKRSRDWYRFLTIAAILLNFLFLYNFNDGGTKKAHIHNIHIQHMILLNLDDLMKCILRNVVPNHNKPIHTSHNPIVFSRVLCFFLNLSLNKVLPSQIVCSFC